MVQHIILASTSLFRSELLRRLQLPFDIADPHIDESALPSELPAATAQRLAQAKAQAVARQFPNALIIGADQVAAYDEQRFGKPGTRQNARQQLRLMRGNEIVFHTGLCVLNSATGHTQVHCIPTYVGFRDLTDAEIEAYLDKEDALNCAGSAKSEGLGIALLRYQRGDDPTALIGLPLIALCEMLRSAGVPLP
ncbi:septum formation inhibitor Maf [Rugosibacter aromaticivorans]|uniref:7-methyl-GTP pyrophosphatase n=1 Tax=Rugosibacter aromaticivorans TaxID=1565605 RepID=A0A0C5IZY3_9PROT|nr:Maf family nucleotide pyrophosphatase [Rugosibacter aromaticivorans]AJP48377.1 septum formation inhibitor Maf [Rugosibacter aromaticivorans]TBR13806.1 MAG: septum formation inhibitor Maf [Rugosibacter sp.]